MQQNLLYPVLAFDYDGTIAVEAYPEAGQPHELAIQTINDLAAAGYEIIIWTARGDSNLPVVKKSLREHGLTPNVKFNQHSNYFTSLYPIESPKVNASIFFDDRSYLAPDYSNPETWMNIRKLLLEE